MGDIRRMAEVFGVGQCWVVCVGNDIIGLN